MPVTLSVQDDRDIVDKMTIGDAGAPLVNQTVESAGAVFKPRVIPPKSEPDEREFMGATEHIQDKIYENINPIIRLPATRAPHRLFEVLQQWEGIVSKVTEDSVWADLVDLTDRTRSEEVVELPLAEISEADRSILRPGSVFYWAIGREWSRGGQMRRVSEIRVRRTPQWSQHSVDVLKAKAMTLMDQFNDHSENSTATSQ